MSCRNLSSTAVVKSLFYLFSIFGMLAYIHSDRGAAFFSQELTYLLDAHGIVTSRIITYSWIENGQVKWYNGIIGKIIHWATITKGLRVIKWKILITNILHSIRSLLYTAINFIPNEWFFCYSRRSSNSTIFPSWLNCLEKVYIKRHVRVLMGNPLVKEVDLIEKNPDYTLVHYDNSRNSNIS